MRDWFESLEQREQSFVSIGAAAVVVALVYALVWAPLDAGQKTLTASVAVWERSLADLKPLKNTVDNDSAAQPISNGANLAPVVIVDQTLKVRGLDRALKRSQPTTSNGIRVEFENVAFDELVFWLSDLSEQYGLQVTSGTMSKNADAPPGRINATFTLERG